MPPIDIFFIVLIALMVLHGFFKGFIGELFSWAGLVLAIWVAVLLFPAGGAFIRTKMMENVRVVPELLAFIALFLLILIAVKFLERILKNVVEGANLGTVNKLLGAVFGLVEGFALTLLVIFVLSVQPLFDASGLVGESIFHELLLPFIRFLPNHGQETVNVVLAEWSVRQGPRV